MLRGKIKSDGGYAVNAQKIDLINLKAPNYRWFI
jgi:hypothetical protein